MGVNLRIYVHKDDLGKLLDVDSRFPIWNDFLFLVDYTIVRWHTFEREFHLNRIEENIYETGITSKGTSSLRNLRAITLTWTL